MEMIGRLAREPPRRALTLSPRALPRRSQRAQSTQAIASTSVFRSRVAWVSANSVSQIRSPSKMLRPVTRGASSSWIRRTISRPCSRLSPLYTSLTSPASVRMRVMTVQRLRTAYVLPPKFFVSGISIAIASTLWTRMVPCRPDPLAPSVRHDRGARHVALVLLNEGVVDRVERELVGDDLLPRVARERAVHEVERAAQMLGFVVREAEDLAVAEDDPRGVELGFPADIDVADLQIRPLGRRHPEPLVDHLRVADQLHDDVAAPAVRERLDSRHAGLRRRMLAQIDDLVGAEPPRQLEPRVHAVDDDHARPRAPGRPGQVSVRGGPRARPPPQGKKSGGAAGPPPAAGRPAESVAPPAPSSAPRPPCSCRVLGGGGGPFSA